MIGEEIGKWVEGENWIHERLKRQDTVPFHLYMNKQIKVNEFEIQPNGTVRLP